MGKKNFKSQADWVHFCYYITQRNRYILDKKSENFITALLCSAKKRAKEFKSGEEFFRARNECRERKRSKYSVLTKKYPLTKKEMLNPTPEKAREGRANPKGISYLYLSKDITTSIAETRPWLNQVVTVAFCKLRKNIRVASITSDDDWIDLPLYSKKRVSPEKKERRIWYDIARDFSTPVIVSEVGIKYIPTQFIAEILKHNKYDGVFYKSSLSETGYNLVLFDDILTINVYKTQLYYLNQIQYKATEYNA